MPIEIRPSNFECLILSTLIVVDEPELYLHPDVQRQLLGILRDCGADVLMATHSTEIMSEADPTEILIVDKTKRNGERLRDVDGIQRALTSIGSIQNITLTRLARNRRVLFVEGDTDTRLIMRFARKLGFEDLATGADLTCLESGGFSSWQRIRSLASAFEDALGFDLHVGAVFDRDYWCDEEIAEIRQNLEEHLEFAHLHEMKELENYLLMPAVLDRAIDQAIEERIDRGGLSRPRSDSAANLLAEITQPLKSDMQAQYLSKRLQFFEKKALDTSTINKQGLEIFEDSWVDMPRRIKMAPGKAVLAKLRAYVAQEHSINLTDHRLVSAFEPHEVPEDMRNLIVKLDLFRRGK